ncbi:methyl-accepting chemotaxis protein, partial [Salmonella enterica]|uniref:methyl-accepting chemotaxis protein n=1 Tax=Salmonella enterica TaxID=28901 RepID=UPI0022B5FFCB
TALVGQGDTVLEDRLNHASLLDAGLLSGARFNRYLHNDASSLAKMNTQTEKIDQHLADLSSRLKHPADLQRLQEATRLVASFKTALAALPALIEQRESIRPTLKK